MKKSSIWSYYRIADLYLQIHTPENWLSEACFPSFIPFANSMSDDEFAGCIVEFVTEPFLDCNAGGKLLSNISVMWGANFGFYECGDGYITKVVHGNVVFLMKSNVDFSQSTVFVPTLEKAETVTLLAWFVMVAFGQWALKFEAILIHASVVFQGKEGVAFLGKSGTGKSTHSKLWLENIEHTILLNDDNPMIRIDERSDVWIYGTPWSGKTPCYKSVKVKLIAIVRLKQALFNQLTWTKGGSAFITVLPSCSAIRWNRILFKKMNDVVDKIIHQVPVAELQCQPNGAAARYCCDEIMKQKNGI